MCNLFCRRANFSLFEYLAGPEKFVFIHGFGIFFLKLNVFKATQQYFLTDLHNKDDLHSQNQKKIVINVALKLLISKKRS